MSGSCTEVERLLTVMGRLPTAALNAKLPTKLRDVRINWYTIVDVFIVNSCVNICCLEFCELCPMIKYCFRCFSFVRILRRTARRVALDFGYNVGYVVT
mmetsp:Transcript_1074/g.1424  ORF Transcript_1074/g.1424 Transcript_1074/m.1424 type:complete len:99 (+) Transcript_1074:941-1237(+)